MMNLTAVEISEFADSIAGFDSGNLVHLRAKRQLEAALALQRERIVAELRAQADKGFSPNTGPTDWARALADFADHLEATR